MKKNLFSIKKTKWGLIALLTTFCVLFADKATAQFTTNFTWGGGLSNSANDGRNWSTTGRYVHTANFASGATTVTIVTPNLQVAVPGTVLAVGHSIVGAGIPFNTTVAGTITTPGVGTTITLSQPTTAAGSATIIQTYLRASSGLFSTSGTSAANQGLAQMIIDNADITQPVFNAIPNAITGIINPINAGSILIRNQFGSLAGPTLTIDNGATLNIASFQASPIVVTGGKIINNGNFNITSNSLGASFGMTFSAATVAPTSGSFEYGYEGSGNLNITSTASTVTPTNTSGGVTITSINPFTTHKLHFNGTSVFNLSTAGTTNGSYAIRNTGGATVSPVTIGGTGFTVTGGGILATSQGRNNITIESGTTITMNSSAGNVSRGINTNSSQPAPTNITNRGTINMLGASTQSGIAISNFTQALPVLINFNNEGTLNIDLNISGVAAGALFTGNGGGAGGAGTLFTLNNTGTMTLKNTSTLVGSGFGIFTTSAGETPPMAIINSGTLNIEGSVSSIGVRSTIVNNGTINSNSELRSFTSITNNLGASINFVKNSLTDTSRLVTFNGIAFGNPGSSFARSIVGGVYTAGGVNFTVITQKFGSFSSTLTTVVSSSADLSAVTESGTLTRNPAIVDDGGSTNTINYGPQAAVAPTTTANGIDAGPGVSVSTLKNALRGITSNLGTINTGAGFEINNISGVTNTSTGVIAPGGSGFGVTDLGTLNTLTPEGTLRIQVAGTTVGTNSDQLTNTFGGSGYSSAPTLIFSGGAGSAATAVATISGGVIIAITPTNGGTGYVNAPLVTITSSTGTGATAVANLTDGVVTSFTVTTGGSTYTAASVSVSSTEVKPTATATVSGGAITGFTILTPGSGYSSSPTVTFSGGGGIGAAATATVSGGVVTGINTALSLSSLNLDITSLYTPEVDVTIPIVTTSGAGTITGSFASVTPLASGWSLVNNVATKSVELSYDWVLPSTLTFCSGATVANAIGGSTMKFYKDNKPATLPLIGTTKLANATTLFVTETPVGGIESARSAVTITVNGLPAKPAAVVSNPLDESKLICKYIGTSTPITFDATAVPGAISYLWTAPGTAQVVSGGTTSSAGISFAMASATAGSIGSVIVRAVDANGCISLPTALALVTKAPKAPGSLVMTSTDSTPHFDAVTTPAVSGVSPAIITTVGLNFLSKITKVGPYMGTGTIFTLTAATDPTAASYAWTLPSGVTQLSGGNGNIITANFAGVASGIGALPVTVQSVGGCGLSSNRTLTLARVVPGAPKALTLTSLNTTPRFSYKDPITGITALDGLDVLTKITKVGPYQSTGIGFVLTSTPVKVQGATATSYAWVLPAGVTCTSCTGTTVTQRVQNGTTPEGVAIFEIQTFSAFKTTSTVTPNSLSILFGTTGIGNLDLLGFAINGAGNSVAKKLVVTRTLPTAPTKLVLTDPAISTTVPVAKVGAYIGKTTPLTLTGTPFTVQGAEGRKFYWTLPAGVNVLSGVIPAELITAPITDVNGNKTWTSAFTSNANPTPTTTGMQLTINLAGIPSGITSIPLSVQSQNEAGTSATTRTLTVTGAIPATPAITSSTGATFTKCANAPTTYTATTLSTGINSYTWTIPAGAVIIGSDTGSSIVVNYENTTILEKEKSAVTCYATNGVGNSATKSYSVTRVASSCPVRLSDSSASAFSVTAYPNPSSSEFTIETSAKGAINAKVYDMQGRLVEKANSNKVGSRLAAGTYNVIVNQGANTKTLRVIKK